MSNFIYKSYVQEIRISFFFAICNFTFTAVFIILEADLLLLSPTIKYEGMWWMLKIDGRLHHTIYLHSL